MHDKSTKPYYADYGYPPVSERLTQLARPEYPFIVAWVAPNSRVLDLGCGDGSLGARLLVEKNCVVLGIDVSTHGVAQARAKGVQAEVGDIDAGLNFTDQSFDYVIINVTLQMVYRPGHVLNEALRVGRQVIVSFPNFGFWLTRLELLLRGRFPTRPLHGYHWYDTRHIHLFSYHDFLAYLAQVGARVKEARFLGRDSQSESFLAAHFPNLCSALCIVLVEKTIRG